MSGFRVLSVRLAVLFIFCVGPVSTSVAQKLLFSTNIGGTGFDEALGVATDGAGNVYIAGLTTSPSFNGNNTPPFGNSDILVVKFSPSGQIIYSKRIGGSNFSEAHAIAVDSNGNAYIAGATGSADFPIMNGFQTNYGGDFSDAFILKLDSVGNIAYSSYLGGSGGDEEGFGIAVDNNGNAYVVGVTNSLNFPVKNASQSTFGGIRDAFVARVNTNLIGADSLVYSTYLGGFSRDVGDAVAVDGMGYTYVTGTAECCFPTTFDAYQPFIGNSSPHVFVTQFDPNGRIVYSTLVGGSEGESARGIALDNSGDVYVCGETSSPDFPVTSQAFQGVNNASPALLSLNAFVIKLNPRIAGSAGLLYSTYLGEEGPDSAAAVAVDGANHIFLTGYTSSATFPVQNAIQPSLAGVRDGFLVELDPNLNGQDALLFGTFLGGQNDAEGLGIALGPDMRLAVAGFTDGQSRDALTAYFSFDNTPPTLSVPRDTVVNATSPAGASFAFTVSATDNGDPHPVVNCLFTSGTVFPIGTTLVTCTATDASGNSATGSFHITVEGAANQLSDLEHYIGSLFLSNGLTNSLDTKLQAALQDPLAGACSDLSDTISEVNAHTGKDLSIQQATFIDTAAARIKAVLGCH